MAGRAETTGVFLDGGGRSDRIIVFARAAGIAWTLARADFATVRLTALPVDPGAQSMALRGAGFEVQPIRRRLHVVSDPLTANARVAASTELEAVVVSARALLGDTLTRLDVVLAAPAKMTFWDHETIEFSAAESALRERVVDGLLLELAPFAATLGITLRAES
jgi:hypothetical protein